MGGTQVFSDRPGRLPRREAARLADLILKKEKQKRPVNIILTDDRLMARLNYRFRRRRRATDVLAFPTDPDEGLLGEIYISVDAARRQAAECGHTVGREILHLVAHGVLHLCGHDHHSAVEAATMKKREEACLAAFWSHV